MFWYVDTLAKLQAIVFVVEVVSVSSTTFVVDLFAHTRDKIEPEYVSRPVLMRAMVSFIDALLTDRFGLF